MKTFDSTNKKRGIKMFYAIIMLVVSLFIALFAVQNSVLVNVQFLSYKFEANLVIVILVSLFSGAILSSIWTLKIKAQNYLKYKKLEDTVLVKDKKITKLEEELKTLKATALSRVDNTLEEKEDEKLNKI